MNIDPKYKRGLQVLAVGVALLVAAYFNQDISAYVNGWLNGVATPAISTTVTP
jgi:hypothetical protein